MKPERKNGKPQIYKEVTGGSVILVTSRDPLTKIQVLKEKSIKKQPKPKYRRQNERGFGIFSMLD